MTTSQPKLGSCPMTRPSWAFVRAFVRAVLVVTAMLAGWQRALADITFGAYGGYAPSAQLARSGEKTMKVGLFPLAGELGHVLGANSILSLHTGLTILHGRVVYREAGTTYAGVLNAQGVSVGLGVWFGNIQALVQGVSLLQSVLSVRSEIHAVVNDDVFKHSNLMSYRGQGGVLGRLSLLTETSDKQFARFTRMRFGVALEGFQQPFSSYTLNINTNDPNIGPGGIWKSSSAASLQYASISVLLGFIF